jgi:hypothetical protein
MKAGTFRRMFAIAIVAIAAVFVIRWYIEYSRREAIIASCVDEGAGAMFSSRESCEELYARNEGATPATREDRAQTREPPRLPFYDGTGFLHGDRLRVPRQGEASWNGVPVDQATLGAYLGESARIPAGPRLFVEFEPGVAQAQADRVRQQIVDSGLCGQHRCAEVGWNVPRPVVN